MSRDPIPDECRRYGCGNVRPECAHRRAARERKRTVRKRAKDVPGQHAERIARQTLAMHDAMAGVMGGPTKAEARERLRALGYTEWQLRGIEDGDIAP